MPEDIIKPKGPLRRSTPNRGGSNPRIAPCLGIVKDNVDPTRSGKIMVYIVDNSGTDPDNKDSWKPVRFLSPFFGFTRPDSGNTGLGKYVTNPSSYGMWMSPPDIGTTVLCLFVDGDMNYGFYVGCVPEPEAMQMLPAIGATENIVPNSGEAQSYGGAKRLPVTNINSVNKNIADTPDYLTAPKPVHSYSSAIMFQQGILRDPIRGPISSSSQRETPSRVGWGISTPGRPIFEGGYDDTSIADNLKEDKAKQLRVISRRGGHTIVMDDGDVIGRDNLVRIRTSLGHQILMSDDGQTLMILHSNGQSYVELGKEGTVDVYSTNSVNIRTQGDLNLHADNDVNIHANKKLNFQADEINFTSEKTFKARVGTDYNLSTGGLHTTKVAGAYAVAAGGQASMLSSAEAFVNGSKVNLNSGKSGTTPKEVPAIEKTLHTDTLFDKQKGWLAAPAKLVSITSRAPAHAPWANAGQGVDVKTDNNASSALPASPSSAVAQTSAVASSAGVSSPVSQATTSAAPATKAASPALDKNATKAITGAVATSAASSPLADAATKGAAVAQTAQGATVGVGQFAQTPQQLEKSGVLKPGSAPLVQSIAAATGNAAAALSPALFTGQPGAQNLQSFVGNVQAQTDSLVKNLSAAQTQLQNAGAITGKESAGAIGGLVMSAAQNGAASTLSAIQNVSAQLQNPLAALPSLSAAKGKLDGVMKDIGAGNFAAKLGESAGGALSGLQDSVEAAIASPSMASVVEQAKGISASAFAAIKGSLPDLKPNEPINLTSVSKDIAANTLAAGTTAISNAGAQLEKAEAAAKSIAGANNPLGQAASDMASGLTSKTQSLLSTALPKASSVADSIVGAASKGTGLLDAAGGATQQLSALAQNNPLGGAASAATASAFSSAKSLLTTATTASGSFSQVAQAVNSGLTSSTASAVASGLTNLPGGQAAAGAITNLAKSALPSLPGTGSLKAGIAGAATNAMNNTINNLSGQLSGLQSQLGGAAASALGGALGGALGKLGDLQSKADGLKSLATKGLPAGAAAELQSAMGSVASAGSGIKMPSVAVNTSDRASIKEAVKTQLDDARIPEPKINEEVDEAAISKVEAIKKEAESFKEQVAKLVAERDELGKKMDAAADEMNLAIERLPAGDPAIKAAKDKYTAAAKEWKKKSSEVDVLVKNATVQEQSTTSATGLG